MIQTSGVFESLGTVLPTVMSQLQTLQCYLAAFMIWLELVCSGEVVTQFLYQTSFFANPEKSAYDEFLLSSPGVSLISGVRSYASSASRLN